MENAEIVAGNLPQQHKAELTAQKEREIIAKYKLEKGIKVRLIWSKGQAFTIKDISGHSCGDLTRRVKILIEINGAEKWCYVLSVVGVAQ